MPNATPMPRVVFNDTTVHVPIATAARRLQALLGAPSSNGADGRVGWVLPGQIWDSRPGAAAPTDTVEYTEMYGVSPEGPNASGLRCTLIAYLANVDPAEREAVWEQLNERFGEHQATVSTALEPGLSAPSASDPSDLDI